MDIIIDFDGTVVTHEYPAIGKSIGAEPVLKELVAAGHNLILFTMRSNIGQVLLLPSDGIENVSGDFLNDAVKWFEENGIPLYGVQVNPTQHTWTTSPKAYGQIIIDDAALGCPLTNYFPNNSLNVLDNIRPFVNWTKAREKLVELGYLVA